MKTIAFARRHPKYLRPAASKYLLLPVLLCAPLCAFAGAPESEPEGHAHTPGDGHDHSAPKPAKDESNVDYFWRKSDEAFHDGDYPRAIALHRAIVALEPGHVESWSLAAWLLWSLGKGEDAVAHIERGLKANPKNAEMWSAAGQHFDLQKLGPRTLEAYKRAVELWPADGDKQEFQMLRRRLAHAADKGGDLALSIETWRGLVRDYPDEPVNKNNLARVEAKAPAAVAPAAAALGAGAALAGGLVLVRRKRRA
jgi:tetratricopeptide (TPR) repeat protein